MQWRVDTMTQDTTLDYRYKYLEEKVNGHDERIKGLEYMSIEFTKISTILEMQQDMNKKQDETLIKINDNLTQLNQKSDRLGERVDSLEGEVKESSQRDNISFSLTVRKVLWTVATVIIGGLFGWVFKFIQGQ